MDSDLVEYLKNSLWVPRAPLASDPPKNIEDWRHGVENALLQLNERLPLLVEEVDTVTSVSTSPGFNNFHYALDCRPFATRTVDYGVAWCLETDTYYLAVNCYNNDRTCIYERRGARWVPLASGTPTLSGNTEVTITDPMDVIYVPAGTGTHRGKFWVCSSASDTITTIDPHNSFATATFTLGVAETNVKQLVYDADNDKVWAVTAAGATVTTPFGGTRIIRINPSDGTNEAQATPGGGAITSIVPTASKIWYSKTSGLATERVQYLNPSTLANTNPGIAVGAASVDGLALCSEIDRLAVIEGAGGNTVRFWNITNDTEESSINTGVAHYCYRAAYVHADRALWIGGVTTPIVLDVVAGCALSRTPATALGSGSGTGFWDSYYIPELNDLIFKEALAGGVLNYWWVYPSA